jgi:hypothetical protein
LAISVRIFAGSGVRLVTHGTPSGVGSFGQVVMPITLIVVPGSSGAVQETVYRVMTSPPSPTMPRSIP